MIVAVGTDIIDHESIKKLKWKENPNLLKRLFCEQELVMFSEFSQMNFLYGRFAAKEAVLKCLGIGMIDGLSLTDIRILRDSNGQPVIDLIGMANEIAQSKNITKWKISISHSDTYSLAFVIAEH